jgi:hypothetical protein
LLLVSLESYRDDAEDLYGSWTKGNDTYEYRADGKIYKNGNVTYRYVVKEEGKIRVYDKADKNVYSTYLYSINSTGNVLTMNGQTYYRTGTHNNQKNDSDNLAGDVTDRENNDNEHNGNYSDGEKNGTNNNNVNGTNNNNVNGNNPLNGTNNNSVIDNVNGRNTTNGTLYNGTTNGILNDTINNARTYRGYNFGTNGTATYGTTGGIFQSRTAAPLK